MSEKRIKVLIVEDSLVDQKLLRMLVNSDERFELIAVAENGKQACEFVHKYNPDVVSMDLMMPIMDGVEATLKIMQELPKPIVVVSSFYDSSEVDMAMKVLQAGAVTILPKQYGPGHAKYEQSAKKYLNTLKLMSEIKVVKRSKSKESAPVRKDCNDNAALSDKIRIQCYDALAIGASAGGPDGLVTILSGLPSNFQLPVFVVQHIDGQFAEGFVSWLNNSSKLPVSIAKNGEKALPGHVYLPPADSHLVITSRGIIMTTNDALVNSARPSVDVLFRSMAQVYGKKSLVVLLSGMGKDGAYELKKLFDLGAYTLAQNEESCLVFGMPGEAAKLGAVSKLLSPDQILQEILHVIKI